MLRVLKILEVVWLAIGIFSLVMGAYRFNNLGWEDSKWFFAGALMAGIFFAFRRRQRQKFEKAEENTNENPN